MGRMMGRITIRGRVLVPALAIGVVLAAWFLRRAGLWLATQTPAPPMVSTERAVAVLSLRNESGAGGVESGWLATGFSEMLATQLTARGVTPIPRDNIERMQAELNIRDASELSHETLSRIRTNIGADVIIAGSYIATPAGAGGSVVSVDISLLDGRSGGSLGTVRETGGPGELIEMAGRAGARLREELGAAGLSRDELRSLRFAMPRETETLRLYSEGLARLRAFDALSARSYLERAVVAEPSFVLAHAALSDALSFLGHTDGAIEEARKAHELSLTLPRPLRLFTEETYLGRCGKWEESAAVCQELALLYPGSVDHGLSLSYVLARSGRMQDAFRELDRLRRLPAPRNGDPRIDMAEAWFSDEDPERRLNAARRAAMKAEAAGMRSMLGMALFAEGNARDRLGQLEQAERCYERAGDIRSASGDRGGLGNVLGTTSALLVERGELDEAVTSANRAEGLLRELGDRRGLAEALRYKSAALIESGRLAEAERPLRESISLFESLSEPSDVQRDHLLRASMAAQRGDLETARRLCQKALEAGLKRQRDDLVAGAEQGLAEVLLIEDRLAEARTHVTRARDLRRRMGDRVLAAKADSRLAAVLLAEGRADEALLIARETVAQFARDGRRDWEAEARATMALALGASGRTNESRGEIERAMALSRSSQSPRVRARVAVAAAAAGAGPDAAAALAAAARETNDLGFGPLHMELRLATIRLDATEGRDLHVAGKLEALKRDAESAGFRLVARQASIRR